MQLTFRTLATVSASLALGLPALPLTTATAQPPAAVKALNIEDRVAWQFAPFSNLLGEANAEDTHVLVYFWMASSGQCEQFYLDTLQSDGGSDATEPFVCYSADHADPAGYKLFERYQVTTVPAVRVVDASGQAIDGINGFADVATFTAELERIRKGEGTLADLRTRTAAAPDDLSLRNQLAGKLFDLGDVEQHDALQASIRTDDPDGSTPIGASLLLNEVIQAATAEAKGPDSIDMRAVYDVATKLEEQSAAFQAWNWLAFVESTRGEAKAEVAALRQAWARVPDGQAKAWGQRQSEWLLGRAAELDEKDHGFVLELAQRSHDLASAEHEELSAEQGSDQAGLDAHLASYVGTLARAYQLTGQEEGALELAEACGDLDPAAAEHRMLEAAFARGELGSAATSWNDTRPVWSPNGKQVLFTSDRDGNQELYLAASKPSKRSKLERLTHTQSNETSGSFDSKGKTIAFNSDRFATWTIYRMTTKGKQLGPLMPIDPSAPVSLSDPCYSPNGKQLVYTTTVNGKSEIAVAKADGSDERVLTAETPNADMQPFWAKKGDRILYMSTRMGDSDVYSISAEGMEDHNITQAPKDSWDMDGNLSPDGKRVVFASWRSGTLEVYSMALDGSDVVDLTKSPETQDRHPRWSPNGKQIAFERGTQDGNTRIWVMETDGSEARPLLN